MTNHLHKLNPLLIHIPKASIWNQMSIFVPDDDRYVVVSIGKEPTARGASMYGIGRYVSGQWQTWGYQGAIIWCEIPAFDL